MAQKSYVDVAYEVLKHKYEENNSNSIPVAFADLILAVGEKLGITEERKLMELASRFYTSLILDGRFVIKENNTWVLKEYELFENVHIDMNDVYSEDENDANSDEIEKELGEEEFDDIELRHTSDEEDE